MSGARESSEFERRISELMRVGVISEVQHEKGLCRISFGERVSPLSPWFTRRSGKDKEFWHPDIGEQAVFFSPYGDGSEGFVLLGIFSDKIPLPEGAREGKHITEYGKTMRIERDRNAGVIRIKGDIEIEGDVKIDGNVMINGNLSASGTVMDAAGNTNHHSH